MTRSDFTLLLLIATLSLTAYQQDAVALCAFITASFLHAGLVLLPLVYQTSDERLRKEFSNALASLAADLETLKNRMDVITLSRGGR